MKRIALTTLAALFIMTAGSQAAETKSQPTQLPPTQGGLTAQEIAKKRQQTQQQIQQEMQPQIQQQRQLQMQMQGGLSSTAGGAPLPPANLVAPRYQLASRMLGGSIMPNMIMQPYMPGPAMLRFGTPFNQMTGQMPPAIMWGGMGQGGFGMGAAMPPRFGMAPVASPLSAMGAGAGVIPGLGMNFGPGTGLEMPEDVQKFLDETTKLRRELHAKKFDYFEAARNKKTPAEEITRLENEMVELRTRIFQRATGQK